MNYHEGVAARAVERTEEEAAPVLTIACPCPGVHLLVPVGERCDHEAYLYDDRNPSDGADRQGIAAPTTGRCVPLANGQVS